MTIWSKINELLYPRTCIVCGRKSGENSLVCEGCSHLMRMVKEPRCKKCGKQLYDVEEEYCHDCENAEHIYEYGFGAFYYNEYLKKSIYDFKYHNVRDNARLYGIEIAKALGKEIKMWEAEALIPVPMYKEKQKKRGYNQTELLADAISNCLGIPVERNLLIRTRNTRPQKELNGSIRKKNVENAFKIHENVVRLEKAILVDDIYTTGATIDECTRVLKAAGVKKVYYIAICIGNAF